MKRVSHNMCKFHFIESLHYTRRQHLILSLLHYCNFASNIKASFRCFQTISYCFYLLWTCIIKQYTAPDYPQIGLTNENNSCKCESNLLNLLKNSCQSHVNLMCKTKEYVNFVCFMCKILMLISQSVNSLSYLQNFFYLFIIKGKILAIPKLTIVEISFLGSI